MEDRAEIFGQPLQRVGDRTDHQRQQREVRQRQLVRVSLLGSISTIRHFRKARSFEL